MAASRDELERQLMVLRTRAADVAAEGGEDPQTAWRLREVQAQLRALEVEAGGLPARESGVWSPLPLYPSGPVSSRALPALPPAESGLSLAEPTRPEPSALARLRLSNEIDEILHDLVTGAHGQWSRKGRSWRRQVLEDHARGHTDPAVKCIANGALRVLTGQATAAPRITTWDDESTSPRGGTEAPDAVTGLTSSGIRVLTALAVVSTPESPARLADVIAATGGALPPARVEAELRAFTHVSRAHPLVLQNGDRLHATSVALELLRGNCVLPMLLVNGFEGEQTHVPPHPITETIDAVIQRLDLPGATFAPALLPDPRASGVISRETIAAYLLSGKGVLCWRARAKLRQEPEHFAEVWVSDLSWPLPPRELEQRIDFVRRDLGRLVGVVGVRPVGPDELYIRVAHERFSLGVWWELLSSGILERRWPVDFKVRHRDQVRRMTGLELIDAFIERRLESFATNSERTELQLAWDRSHAQEAVCVALRALEGVMTALGQEDPASALTAFRAAGLGVGLPLKSSHDYGRGFSEAQVRHLVGMTDLSSRQVADEDARWVRLRADVEKEIARPVANTPRARLRRELLELRAKFGEARQTTSVEALL